MYTTQGGAILEDGKPIQLRGISHFGFNATILQPQYLWKQGWKAQLAQIKSLGFNAVRVPFVPETLYAQKTLDNLSFLAGGNEDFVGKTPLQALDLWMAHANSLGLYLLLDFHSVSAQRQYPTWYCNEPKLMWNEQPYTTANWLRDLTFVAKRYARLPKFIGIDIDNEPNGAVRWSTGDGNMTNAANHWKAAAESAGAAILAANPNLLIFVQGIAGNFDGIEKQLPTNWGEDLQPQAYQPLAIQAGKLVLSPHTYGPDVFEKTSFNDPAYPKNLPADWDTLFGQFSSKFPVVPGEWGGRYGKGISASTGKASGPADIAWQNAFVDYMISRGITSSFYWCYTPNSGDTGGILDDDLNLRQDKMDLMQRLWKASPAAPAVAVPASPQVTVTNGNIEITGKGSVTITVR